MEFREQGRAKCQVELDPPKNQKKRERNLLELISEFGQVSEYKVNVQRLIVFLRTSNEQSENEIKKTIYNIIKKIKILRNKFNKRSLSLVH